MREPREAARCQGLDGELRTTATATIDDDLGPARIVELRNPRCECVVRNVAGPRHVPGGELFRRAHIEYDERFALLQATLQLLVISGTYVVRTVTYV